MLREFRQVPYLFLHALAFGDFPGQRPGALLDPLFQPLVGILQRLLAPEDVDVLPLDDAVGSSDDQEQHRVQQPEYQQQAGREPGREALDLADERSHVRIELENPLYRTVAAPDRQVAFDEIPVEDTAVEGAELALMDQLACRFPVARGREKAGIVALVGADLAFLRGKHGEPVEVIDFDLEHRQSGGDLLQGVMDLPRFRARPQGIAIETRDPGHIIGETRPYGVGERARQRHVLSLRRFDQVAHRVVAIERHQRDGDRKDGDRAGQGKMPKKLEH